MEHHQWMRLMVKGLLCHVRKLGLFPTGNGALMGGFKQGSDVIVALVNRLAQILQVLQESL